MWAAALAKENEERNFLRVFWTRHGGSCDDTGDEEKALEVYGSLLEVTH